MKFPGLSTPQPFHQQVSTALQQEDPRALMDAFYRLGEQPDGQLVLEHALNPLLTPLTPQQHYFLYVFVLNWADVGLERRGLLANAHLSVETKKKIQQGLDRYLALTNRNNEPIKVPYSRVTAANVVLDEAKLSTYMHASYDARMRKAIADYVSLSVSSKSRYRIVQALAVLCALTTGLIVGGSVVVLAGLMIAYAPVTLALGVIAGVVALVKSYGGTKSVLLPAFFKGHGLFEVRDKDTGELKEVALRTKLWLTLSSIPSVALGVFFLAVSYVGIAAIPAKLAAIGIVLGVTGSAIFPPLAIALGAAVLVTYTIVVAHSLAKLIKGANIIERCQKRLNTLFNPNSERYRGAPMKAKRDKYLTLAAMAILVPLVLVGLMAAMFFGRQTIAEALLDQAFAILPTVANTIASAVALVGLVILIPVMIRATFAGITRRVSHSKVSTETVAKLSDKSTNADLPLSTHVGLVFKGFVRAVLGLTLQLVNLALHLPLLNIIPMIGFWLADKYQLWSMRRKYPALVAVLQERGLDPLQFIVVEKGGKQELLVPKWVAAPLTTGERISNLIQLFLDKLLPMPKHATNISDLPESIVESCDEGALDDLGVIALTEAEFFATTVHATNMATTGAGVGMTAVAASMLFTEAEVVQDKAAREARLRLLQQGGFNVTQDSPELTKRLTQAEKELADSPDQDRIDDTLQILSHMAGQPHSFFKSEAKKAQGQELPVVLPTPPHRQVVR